MVTFEVKGMVYSIKFGMGALITLEEEFGIRIQDMTDESFASLVMLRNLYYCGMKAECSTITIEKTVDILDSMIEEKGMDYIVEVLSNAIEASFGKKQ